MIKISEMLHPVSLFSLCQLLHRPHLNVTNLEVEQKTIKNVIMKSLSKYLPYTAQTDCKLPA